MEKCKHQYLGIHIKMHTPAYLKKHFKKDESILEGKKKKKQWIDGQRDLNYYFRPYRHCRKVIFISQ